MIFVVFLVDLVHFRVVIVPLDIIFLLHVEAGHLEAHFFLFSVLLSVHASGPFLSAAELGLMHPLRLMWRASFLQQLNLTFEADPLLASALGGRVSQLSERRCRF